MTTATTTITIRQLTPVFAAEITGVDLTQLDDATFAEIEDAFETYSILVFPGQPLDDKSQIAFSRRFGELEKTQGHVANNFQVRHVSVISNLDPEGRLMAADDPRVLYRLGQRNWHSDSSFTRVPAKASLLHARVLPPDGGETQFASLRAAYDALPEARKRELEGKVAIHPLCVLAPQLGVQADQRGGGPPVSRRATGDHPRKPEERPQGAVRGLARIAKPRHAGERGPGAADGVAGIRDAGEVHLPPPLAGR